ncbi:MAG: hypothetical protein HC866_03730, partial [Leptolyngbyaceae cyanobacterium RU_5_1]|nr:hypothetical protein [Leptolyngbyaceae cyanobacterium RU_5_1]
MGVPNPKLAQTAQELIWLSQARKHALEGATTIKPTPPQLWQLIAAISTANLIQPTSRYYREAQANLKSWQAQLQDLTLLQLAYTTGEIQQTVALQFAMLQGQQVTSDRPRRAQAQTLIAYWHQEVRKLEDRPYLVFAKELAGKGTIPELRRAIDQAQLIGTERPSRNQAQTLIAGWIGQIQTLEDQPILDQAWSLANQGKLNEAIQVAAGIAPGRALYWQTQSAISEWQAQIRSTELAQQKARESALEKLVPEKTTRTPNFLTRTILIRSQRLIRTTHPLHFPTQRGCIQPIANLLPFPHPGM